MRITQKGEDTAAAELRQAKGENGPSVSASGSLSTRKNKRSDRSDNTSADLSGSLPLYTGGRNQAAIERGEIGVRAAELTTARAREDLKFEVTKAYYDVLKSLKDIAVNQESVDNYDAHYTNVSQRFAAGSLAKVEVLRSSVALSNARQNLIKSQNAYEINLSKLRDFINIDRDEPLNLTDDFSYASFPEALPACLAFAKEHRKDLLIDEYRLSQQELAVKMAKSGYLPKLNLSVGTSLSESMHPYWEHSNGLSAGLSASWNIFDSGVTKAEVDAAKTALEVAQLNLDRDRETVDLAVRQAYYNMEEAEKRFVSTSDAVAEAEEDYFIANEKYKAGEGIMLDIIDAQLALSQAKFNYIDAQYDYASYKAELENAIGRDLTDSELAAAKELPTKVELTDLRQSDTAKAKTENSQSASETDVGSRPASAAENTEPEQPAAREARKTSATVESSAAVAYEAARDETEAAK